MDIYIQATIGLCTEFKQDGRAKKGEVSVVISPTKVSSNEGQDRLQVVTGCNMWQSCHNAGCWYSLAARQKKKA